MERTTEFGVETSHDGATWRLTVPSPLFEALRVGTRQADGSVLVNNGDGTGTRTTYNPDGSVASTEQLTGLPLPPEPEPDPVAELQAQVAELTAALQALIGGD